MNLGERRRLLGLLGFLTFVAAVLAALVVWIFVREEPIDLEIAPAV